MLKEPKKAAARYVKVPGSGLFLKRQLGKTEKKPRAKRQTRFRFQSGKTNLPEAGLRTYTDNLTGS